MLELIALAAVLSGTQVIAIGLVLRHLAAQDDAASAERDAARELHRAESEAFRELLAESFTAHRREIADLCQRIQAPEAAIIQHQQDTSTPGGAIDPVTDTEYEEQQQALRDAIWRIEQAENEGVLP